MGSSMAENHPVGFQWAIEARERGATLIHVDPRYTRTSAMADLWVPLRAGSDIVLLGALIKYVLQNQKDFREYVVNYTNAPVILRDDFKDTEDLEGLFSGWDTERERYEPDTWFYQGSPKKSTKGAATGHSPHGGGHGKDRGGGAADESKYERDLTLRHPRCVYQVLKRHFARYTPELVERLCGVRPEVFQRLAETLCSASGPERTAAICYAVGWTQHSNGVQVIRAAAILHCSSATSAGQGVEFSRCGATRQSRAQRTSRHFMTFFPAIFQCPSLRPILTTCRTTLQNTVTEPGGGSISTGTRSAFLRRITDLPRPQRMISDSIGSLASRAIIRISGIGSTWPTESSRGSSSSGRILPWARPIPALGARPSPG